ncbi:MAG: Succinate dehydrogenase flavoprotein subunit [Syntrophorhabdus sp. PtaU1.Bin058]|nr:MAG: Succinate dehydrogenase flavoprotein subunit [Syntrophorhabdus sp. PtaU1.Bin058]
MLKKTITTDVLIIGGGIAGIRAAIEAAGQHVDVVLANKGQVGKDGAAVWMAGGGYQAALYPPDSIEQHVEDTIKAGKYLNNQALAEAFLRLAPDTVRDLVKWGARFAKKDGKYIQIRLPGETYPRSMSHSIIGESLGGEYRKVLPRQVKSYKEINVLNDIFIVDLINSGETITGAVGLDVRSGEFVAIQAKATILATGGFMALYDFTTANPTLTGDGHGMAYRAGARMMDMEFVQFFPAATLWPQTVYRDNYPYTLLWRLRGVFYNAIGERFMERYFPVEKDFATREAMSRAIHREVKEGRGSAHGGAYLSFRHLPRNLINIFLEDLKDNPYMQGLKEAGVDIHEDAIEIGPAAHYVQGGCWINERCETSLPGLYAVGEVGSGGKDGADRLAGNALPFCMAMGYVAGKEAAQKAKSIEMPSVDDTRIETVCSEAAAPFMRQDGVRPFKVKEAIRGLMSRNMVYDRNKDELTGSLKELVRIREEELPRLYVSAKTERFNLEWAEALEVKNMLDTAEMSMRAALMREESRGLHQRSDFPEARDEWLKHIMIKMNKDGMDLTTEPVTFPILKPMSDKTNS